MLVQHTQFDGPTLELFAKADEATRAIPPLWSLAQTVAVNPFLGQVNEPLPMTAARMAKVAGIAVTQPRTTLLKKINRGDITTADLETALRDAPSALPRDAGAFLERAKGSAPTPVALPTVADLAAKVSGIDWPRLVEDRIGQWAAGHFDAGQALWPAPKLEPFGAWYAYARRDITPEIHGLTGFAARVAGLSNSAPIAMAVSAETLGVLPNSADLYFHRLLMTLGGWAQLARKDAWVAEQAGQRDSSVTDLLSIRLVWEAALLDHYRAAIAEEWTSALSSYSAPLAPTLDQHIDCILQEAAEIAGQRRLAEGVSAAPKTPRSTRATVQAAFCIDVRSEVYRRALEAQDIGIETIGFAGFFGLGVSHDAAASDMKEDRLPVLLSAGLTSASGHSQAEDTDMRLAARAKRAWGRFRQAAVGSFAFVEAAGPLYLPKLLRDAMGGPAATPADGPAPVLTSALSLEDKVTAAKTILTAMGLRAPFARLVLIAGHGAEVTNTPYESAMHCGACGGHTGEVNARLLAGLLNDTEVRTGLADVGIEVPADTVFIGGLHQTTSDRMDLFVDTGCPDHADDLAQLRSWLDAAGATARAERQARLPGAKGQSDLIVRGLDWSQTRPEWGLAGCSSFIAAPRAVTQNLDLGGRAFLHNYDHTADPEDGVLELILTAPVVVASWISLQYYGSSVAPDVFGGGNKLIHNITGGVSVVEGNGATLRGGLAWQSVHDGDALLHDPLRLSVVIAAPTQTMSAILAKHPGVQALFDNKWLHLLAMDDEGEITARYDGSGSWMALNGAPAALMAAE